MAANKIPEADEPEENGGVTEDKRHSLVPSIIVKRASQVPVTEQKRLAASRSP